MAHPGRVITNPITRERITFVRTGAETRGDALVFDCQCAPGGARLPVHIHETYEERFEIVAGTLGAIRGDAEYRLRAGDRIALPPRVKHQWWNAGEGDLLFRVEVTPARELEAALEVICGLAQAGGMTRRCMPRNPFDLAYIGRLSETYLPGIPIPLQRAGLAVLSSVGGLFGYLPPGAERAPVTDYPAATVSLAGGDSA
jgi:mannose-6-phosphate isomerase-like protein (cupin superfamily)